MNKQRYQQPKERRVYFTETLVLSIALSLLILSFFFQTKKIQFVRQFFALKQNSSQSQPVGAVTKVSGKVFRMKAQDAEFLQIYTQNTLEMDDTLLTSENGFLDLELKDGQKINIGPNTLIKLSFQADFWLNGVIQRALVQIQAPRPKPTPKPEEPKVEEKKPEPKNFKIVEIKPKQNQTYTFSAEEYASSKKILFSVKTDQPATPLSVHIFGQTEIETFLLEEGQSTYEKILELEPKKFSAGKYHIEVRDNQKKPLSRTSFIILPKVELLYASETLGISSKLQGMAAKHDFEGFILQWNKLNGSEPYTVTVHDAASDKVLVKAQAKLNKLILNPNKLIFGKMYYTVEKKIDFGFIAYSQKTPFSFALLAPHLTSPTDSAVFDNKALTKNENTIFFTWTKTNYTGFYQLEISADKNFQKIYLKKDLSDNFHTLVAPPVGNYFWRVRANAKGTFSDFSEVRSLSVISE